MLPFNVQHLPAGCEHADSIHHVEFDYYGRRMATAASDKTLVIRSPMTSVGLVWGLVGT